MSNLKELLHEQLDVLLSTLESNEGIEDCIIDLSLVAMYEESQVKYNSELIPDNTDEWFVEEITRIDENNVVTALN